MFNLQKFGPLFDGEDPPGGGQPTGTNGSDPNDGGSVTQTLDEWVEALQDDEQKTLVKGLLTKKVEKLESALGSERETRKNLEKQVRDLAKKADEGSESQQELTKIADQLSEADRKADFYEDAHAAGVTNLKLAFLVATHDELFDRKGQVNFKSMKETYPELFGGQTKPKGNAGNGTNTDEPPEKSMNTFIRRAAGREA